MKPFACALALYLAACGDGAQTHTTAADETTTSATSGADNHETAAPPDDSSTSADGIAAPAPATP